MRKKNNFQGGQSLIEVIIALVLLGIIVVGLSSVVVNSLRNVEFSRNKANSLHLAQSKMEKIRNERDSANWDVFWESKLEDIADGDERSEYETINEDDVPEVNGKYSREVNFINDSNKMMITITVTWEDSLGAHETVITNYLTKWN